MSCSLARGVVHAGQECDRQASAVLVDGRLEVVRRQRPFAVWRPDDDQVLRRVQAVESELQFDRVPVRREGRGVDEDRRSRAGRPEERRQQQVQVDGQRVERGDLAGTRADQSRRRSADGVVRRDPGAFPLEPAVDAETRPRSELGVDGRSCRGRLGAERLTCEVHLGRPVRGRRQDEPIAVAGDGVGRVQFPRVRLPERRRGGGHRDGTVGSGGRTGAPVAAASGSSSAEIVAGQSCAPPRAIEPDVHAGRIEQAGGDPRTTAGPAEHGHGRVTRDRGELVRELPERDLDRARDDAVLAPLVRVAHIERIAVGAGEGLGVQRRHRRRGKRPHAGGPGGIGLLPRRDAAGEPARDPVIADPEQLDGRFLAANRRVGRGGPARVRLRMARTSPRTTRSCRRARR